MQFLSLIIWSQLLFDETLKTCWRIATTRPEGEQKLKFKNLKRILDVLFVVYAGFKCIIKSINTCDNDRRISWTISVKERVPCGNPYYIKCIYEDRLDNYVTNSGEDTPIHFANHLVKDILYDNTNGLFL